MKSVKANQMGMNVNSTGRDQNRSTTNTSMDAISYGVQVRLDESSSFSRRVTDETVNAARALGVSNSIIERWATQRLNRLAHETERLREIRTLLNRTYQTKPPDWMTRRQG